jgi:molecular chaperone DnaK (HSP70)
LKNTYKQKTVKDLTKHKKAIAKLKREAEKAKYVLSTFHRDTIVLNRLTMVITLKPHYLEQGLKN